MKDKLKKKWEQHKAVVYLALGVVGGLIVVRAGYKAGIKTIDVRHAVKIDMLEKDVEKLDALYQEAVWEAVDNLDAVNSVLDYFKASDNDLVALREITGHDIIASD